MYNIQLNERATHHLTLTEQHLNTIERFALLRDLVDSTGYVTEEVLDKLKLNIRALITNTPDDDLLTLSREVIYHEKMKAFGLKNLIIAFLDWEGRKVSATPDPASEQ